MSTLATAPTDPTADEPPDDALGASFSRPVDGTSLAVVRVVLGLLGVASAARLTTRGWVESLLVEPAHHLAYSGMSWVPVPGRAAAFALVATVALSGAAVALGWRYRVAVVVFALSFTWLEFIEASMYLNHYWFVTLLAVLLCALPAASAWSLDARRAERRAAGSGAPAVATVPVIAVWMVRAQVGVVYVFAGLAKLHGDWLVRGLPLALWLPARADHPLLGPIVTLPHAAIVASVAGAVFDCTIVGFLLWRRTRLVAWLVLVGFHIVTWLLFPVIGVFPWVMIAMSTIFFAPDWPRRVLARVRGEAAPGQPDRAQSVRPVGRAWLVAAALWVALQVILPLRYLAYPGDHRWTGEAYRFGWNVMLVEKAGDVSFRVTDPTTGETIRDDASTLFTPQQLRVASTDPELIRQLAHVVAEQHGPGVEVRVDAYMSLNGRAAQRIVDPEVDLAAEPWRLGPQPWILPVPTP